MKALNNQDFELRHGNCNNEINLIGAFFMRFSLIKTTALATGLLLSISAAHAAVITGTYSVIGSNFASTPASPFASITESFTITFNNSSVIASQTAGISLNSASTIIPTSPLAFSYIPGADTLIVGGTASSVTTSDPASTDFALVISGASNTASFNITSLTYSTNGATFTAQTRARTTPPVSPTPTPEPASIVLLGSAMAAIGFIRRRRSK